MERVVTDTRKLADEDKKALDSLVTTRNLLNKEINRAETYNKKQTQEIATFKKTNVEKDQEIKKLMDDMEIKNRRIANLEKEKEKYGINAAQANAKYFHALEEIKLKDNLISEFQKKNIETEAKLKQQ